MSVNIKTSYDPVLTSLSVAFMQNEFLSDIVAPRVPVSIKHGSYPEYDKSNFDVEDAPDRKGMDVAEEIGFSVEDKPYACKWKSRRVGISQDDIDEGAILGVDPVADAAEIVGEKMKRLREKRVAEVYNTATNFITLNDYSVSNLINIYFDDYVSDPTTYKSDPFKVVGKCKKAMQLLCGQFPNHIWANPDIWEVIENHPLRDRKSSQNQDKITNSALPDVFKNMKRLEAQAIYNASKKGRTVSNSYVWGNNIYLAYITPSPGKKKASAVYTFDFLGGLKTEQYLPPAERKGVWVEGNEIVDEKRVCDVCIYIIKNVLKTPLGS